MKIVFQQFFFKESEVFVARIRQKDVRVNFVFITELKQLVPLIGPEPQRLGDFTHLALRSVVRSQLQVNAAECKSHGQVGG